MCESVLAAKPPGAGLTHLVSLRQLRNVATKVAYGRPKAVHNEHGLAATRHLISEHTLCELAMGLRTLAQLKKGCRQYSARVLRAQRSLCCAHGLWCAHATSMYVL